MLPTGNNCLYAPRTFYGIRREKAPVLLPFLRWFFSNCIVRLAQLDNGLSLQRVRKLQNPTCEPLF